MAKINAEQLDLIRQYFLSFTGGQNPEITGMTGDQFPEGFLKEVEEVFTSDDYSKDFLACYLRQKQAEEFSDQLHEIQQEFMFNLAELFIAGRKNEVTDELLKRKNKIFLDEVAFQQAMKENIKLIELEDSNKAFLAIHEQRLKEKTPDQSIVTLSAEPSTGAQGRKSSPGKFIKTRIGSSPVAAASIAGHKKAAQKRS